MPAIFGRVQMWMKYPHDRVRRQLVMLIRGSNSEMIGNRQYVHDLRDVRRGSTTICGNQPAQTLTGIGTSSSSNTDAHLEAVETSIGGTKYLAMYIHPLGQPADPSAQGAIRSVCGRK